MPSADPEWHRPDAGRGERVSAGDHAAAGSELGGGHEPAGEAPRGRVGHLGGDMGVLAVLQEGHLLRSVIVRARRARLLAAARGAQRRSLSTAARTMRKSGLCRFAMLFGAAGQRSHFSGVSRVGPPGSGAPFSAMRAQCCMPSWAMLPMIAGRTRPDSSMC